MDHGQGQGGPEAPKPATSHLHDRMSGLAGQPVQPMRGTKQIRLVLQKDWLQASTLRDQGGRLEVGDKGYVVGLERSHFH